VGNSAECELVAEEEFVSLLMKLLTDETNFKVLKSTSIIPIDWVFNCRNEQLIDEIAHLDWSFLDSEDLDF